MSSIIKHTLVGALLLAAATAPVGAQTQAGAGTGPVLVPITFFGEVRTRSEWNQALVSAPADAFTGLRTRFGARIDAGSGARIVLQLQDSRVLGTEGNTSPAAVAADVFDLHQGYLELNGTLGGVASSLRAGRQEIALGNERLVGAVGWSNTGRSFDGVRWLVSRTNAAGVEQWTASTFAAVMEERSGQFGAASPSENHAVGALDVRRALPASASIDATLLYDRGAKYGSFTNANRATLDAHLIEPRIGDVLRVELEGAYQAGGQQLVPPSGGAATKQTVGAWLAGARVGTPTTNITRASETVGVDFLSGDATPNDARYSAFSTMYATNHPFYGLMDLIAEPATTTKYRGLVDAFAIDSRRLGGPVGFRCELHDFTLATGSNRSLGAEGDVALPVRVNGAATVDIGYSLFRAASGANAIGLGARGSTAQWAYVQMTVGF